MDELVENGDLKERTARRYLIGYLVKELYDAEALAPDVIIAKGVNYRPEPANGHRH